MTAPCNAGAISRHGANPGLRRALSGYRFAPRAMQQFQPQMTVMTEQNQAFASDAAGGNPLSGDWSGPFGVGPFDRVESQHFLPAFARAFAAHEAEVAAIAADAAQPTFANTIEAMDKAGDALRRGSSVV